MSRWGEGKGEGEREREIGGGEVFFLQKLLYLLLHLCCISSAGEEDHLKEIGFSILYVSSLEEVLERGGRKQG